MAGFAKTTNFMLNSATVMLGPMEDLWDLNPEDHSIGLVKNFTLTQEPEYRELTQGQKGTIVYSVMVSNPVRASMEVYEYTAQNIAYGLGLANATTVGPKTVTTNTSSAVPASPGTAILPVDSAVGLAQGDTIMIEVDTIDNFVIRRIVSIGGSNLTLNQGLPAVPDNAKVTLVNRLQGGSKDEQPFYAAKIAGKTVDGDPMVLFLPKVRIVQGFNLSFVTDDYGNMPFELTAYDLVTTDPMYNDFKNQTFEILKAK